MEAPYSILGLQTPGRRRSRSQRAVLYQWHHAVERWLPQLSKPLVTVLSGFSFGVAAARCCTLSAVAEAVPALGKPATVERRLQRFLANQRLDWAQCCQALAAWVLSHRSGRGPVVLLVEESSLQQRLKVMAVSLAYRGRAIPLAGWCYPPTQWPMGQVQLITTLLTWVAAGLADRRPVLVQADRGIGTSPELRRAIDRLGWYYLVRVTKQVRLRVDGHAPVPFARLVSQPGDAWRGQVVACKQAGWIRCWAQGRWQSGHAEPWLLLTNHPDAQRDWYSLRRWEELACRDCKAYGWQWQRSRVWRAERANVLWVVLALADVWMLNLGTQVAHTARLRRELTRGGQPRFSLFTLGLRLLRRRLLLGRRLTVRLRLITHPPPLPKSVVY